MLWLFLSLAAADSFAVCFFGLTRSLRVTLPMIQQRILAPLGYLGRVVVLAHTYDVAVISNPRSNERLAPNDADDINLLGPADVIVDNQTEFLASLPERFCQTHGDAWHDRFKSHLNFMCQLHSQKQLSVLVAKHGPFRAVIYARPDVLFFTALDAQQVLHAQPDTVYVPPFANWDGTNDRFAFGTQEAMHLYGSRFDTLGDYCTTNQAHAERYLRWYLGAHQLRIVRTPMLFGRVRAPAALWERPVWSTQRTNMSVGASLETFA